MVFLIVSPWRGLMGPNMNLRLLARRMLARGHTVCIATPSRDEFMAVLEADGAAVCLLERFEWTPRTLNPLTLARHLWAARGVTRRLAALASSVKANMICFNGVNSLTVPRAGRIAGCPVAAIMRGVTMPPGLAGRLYYGVQKRWVTRYVALTRLGAELLAGVGVSPGAISVCPNGVDTDRFAPGPRDEALAGELGIAQGGPVIGVISHLTQRKGIHHLIETMGRLAGRMPDLKCIVAGTADSDADERYVRTLRGRVAELGLKESIRFIGARLDVPRLLNLFDLLVHPSETENCPTAVLEAQAAGRPVVGFRVGGMPEVVSDGQTGLLIKPFDHQAMSDAILRLLSDRDLLGRMGQAGRQKVLLEYDRRNNTASLVGLLERVAGGA
ncbi:MAG: glycosyltransferase family 4 protein [Phycisphaerae bacterium]